MICTQGIIPHYFGAYCLGIYIIASDLTIYMDSRICPDIVKGNSDDQFTSKSQRLLNVTMSHSVPSHVIIDPEMNVLIFQQESEFYISST